nr:hypothetical protein [Tanacetum cinerariifolium]
MKPYDYVIPQLSMFHTLYKFVMTYVPDNMANENVPAPTPTDLMIKYFHLLHGPTKKGKKTKPHVIPYSRFTKLIIYYLGRHHNIHQRSGSPLNLAEDDLSLGNLKPIYIPKVDPATKEASTGSSAQPRDDTFASVIRETPSLADAEIGDDTDKVISEGDTKILNIALEASIERANRDEFLAKKDKSRKRRHDDQDPLPPPSDSDLTRGKNLILMLQDQNSLQLHSPQHGKHLTREKLLPAPLSNSEDTNTAHLSKIKTRPDWLKPLPAKDRPRTLKPDWIIPLIDLTEAENNRVDALAKSYKDPEMEECHRLLIDQVDLVNPEGYWLVLDVSKSLPIGGPPGQLKAANYPDFRLEELVLSLWIESGCDYNISAAYGITHWWFKRKEFYITRHSAPSDRRVVKSRMQILSVISIKTFERYCYAFLREIVIRIADYNEYKISEANFKNLHPNDFEDMYMLYLQGKLNHLLGSDKVHLYNTINLWIRNIVFRQRDASNFLFKEYYTIVSKPRAMINIDRNDQKKMLGENEKALLVDDLEMLTTELSTEPNDIFIPILRPSIVKPEFGDDVKFEINGNIMRELRRKLFKGTDDEDAHERVRRVLEIADLFHFPGVTHDAVMLRVFPVKLTRPALRWKNKLSAGSITAWDLLKKSFIG